MEGCTDFVLKNNHQNNNQIQQQDEVAVLKKKFQQKLDTTRLYTTNQPNLKTKSQSTTLMTNKILSNSKVLQSNKKSYFPELESFNSQFSPQRQKNISTIDKSSSRIRISIKKAQSKPQKYSSSNYQKPVYQVLIKLKVKPPEAKQKFYQYIRLAPFNRANNHYDLILHFLKQYKFFYVHPELIMNYISKKIIIEQRPFTNNSLWIVQEGYVIINGIQYQKGELANRQFLDSQLYEYNVKYETSQICKMLTLTKYDYQSFISTYFTLNYQKYCNFVKHIPIIKIFSDKAIQKLINNMNCKFLLKNQKVYKVGDKLDNIYIIYTGKAFRKVIVQLDKSNKIPMAKQQYLIKTYHKSYQFKITFQPRELFGFIQVINGETLRSQTIQVEENSLLLYINLNAFHEILEESLIERLRQEKHKKYPQNYQQLCKKFNRQQQEFRQLQRIKIQALQQNCRFGSILEVEKKNHRIQRYVNNSLKKIKQNEQKNYLSTRKTEKTTKNLIH